MIFVTTRLQGSAVSFFSMYFHIGTNSIEFLLRPFLAGKMSLIVKQILVSQPLAVWGARVCTCETATLTAWHSATLRPTWKGFDSNGQPRQKQRSWCSLVIVMLLAFLPGFMARVFACVCSPTASTLRMQFWGLNRSESRSVHWNSYAFRNFRTRPAFDHLSSSFTFWYAIWCIDSGLGFASCYIHCCW